MKDYLNKNPHSVSLIVGIELPKEIIGNIKKMQSIIDRDDLYDSHEPHITLIINTFPSIELVKKKITPIIKKFRPFNMAISGFHTFENDTLTKGNKIFKGDTLVYEVKKTEELAKLQNSLFSELNMIRTKDQEEHIMKNYLKLPEKALKNIEMFGYPVNVDDWIFHCTILAASPEIYKSVMQKIKSYDKSYSWKVDHLCIFQNKGNGYKVIDRIRL